MVDARGTKDEGVNAMAVATELASATKEDFIFLF